MLFSAELIWVSVFTLALILIGCVSMSYDRGGLVGFAIVAYTVLLYWFGFTSVDWIKEHPLQLFVGAVTYAGVIGPLWTFWYWYRYCTRLRQKFDAYKAKHSNAKNNEVMRAIGCSYLQDSMPPLVSEHKATLVSVLAFWPFSMIEHLFTRFLKDLFDTIYSYMSGSLQRISNHIFGDVSSDPK